MLALISTSYDEAHRVRVPLTAAAGDQAGPHTVRGQALPYTATQHQMVALNRATQLDRIPSFNNRKLFKEFTISRLVDLLKCGHKILWQCVQTAWPLQYGDHYATS